jgi:hypothetical protein
MLLILYKKMTIKKNRLKKMQKKYVNKISFRIKVKMNKKMKSRAIKTKVVLTIHYIKD